MKTQSIKEKQKKAFEVMKGDFKYKNPMQAPRLSKVVISVATGRAHDPKRNELVADRLSKITGQKASLRGAKKSVASFKIREGDPIGVMVTLRGKRMYGFLDKLVNVAIPRMKDFRGLEKKSIDEMGNFTTGLKEHTIFTETSNEDLRDVFGMAVTVVTTGKKKEETAVFLELLGFPFKK